MAEDVVYLYAICHDPGQTVDGQLTGVAGSPVRLIRHGDLAAVVSTVSGAEFSEQALRRNLEDLAWVEAIVRAHHDVAGEVAESVPTAPARAATVFRHDDRIRDILRDRAGQLRDLLGQLAGHREWGVKVYAQPRAAREGDAADPVSSDTGRPGTAYLLRRKAQQDQHQQAHADLARQVSQIDSSLARLAVASRHHRPQDPGLTGEAGTMVLNAAYLVAVPDTDRFLAAADQLSGVLTGARLTLTGPWPAYSFATLPDLS